MKEVFQLDFSDEFQDFCDKFDMDTMAQLTNFSLYLGIVCGRAGIEFSDVQIMNIDDTHDLFLDFDNLKDMTAFKLTYDKKEL